VDIGLSSPTGICFGYGAKFPKKYEDALFILDWSYGRIIAVHLNAKGASYTGTQETFVSGRPLNVTDACVGPDGALWFTTGGRGTQSGLYRVTWEGKAGQEGQDEGQGVKDLRALRHELEMLWPKDAKEAFTATFVMRHGWRWRERRRSFG
jgi:sugar lactone lactonase YvrE